MKKFDLFVGLKDLSRVTKSGRVSQRFGLRITVPDVQIDVNAQEIMKPFAAQVQLRLKETLAMGRDPGGAPLPQLTGSSIERRRDEGQQGNRGGEADPRYVDEKFRSRVKQSYARDYKSRLGLFRPEEGHPRGNVSGLLRESIKARPVKAGNGFIVYVAGNRSRPRPGEQLSALESVYYGIRLWNNMAMQAPEVQSALRAGVQGSISVNGVKQIESGLKRLISGGGKLGKAIKELESAIRGSGDDE